MWFIFALIAMLAWGLEEVLVKVNAERDGVFFSLKIAVCMLPFIVGELIIATLLSESGMSLPELVLSNISVWLAIVVYVAVMFICYLGAQYMEMSVFTPVSNSSSGFAIVIILAYAFFTGNYASVARYITPLSVCGMLLTVCGVVALAVVQNRVSRDTGPVDAQTKKYRRGALALLFPLVFCLLDAISTTIDSVNLGASGEAVVSGYDYIRIYTAGYVVISLVSWVIVSVSEKKVYNPFKPFKIASYGVGLCEILATVCYLLALEGNAVLALPVATSYSIVTLVLSRLFLKEKLKPAQYLCIAAAILGVLLVSIVGL